MTPSAQYLETANIEELSRELETEGYQVTRDKKINGSVYDLVATKGDRRIVYEVKARSRLAELASQIATLRKRARQEGFNEFRLIVVNPPKERKIEIEGLEERIQAHPVTNESVLHAMDVISPHTQVTDISGLDINSIEVRPGEIYVSGSGLVEVDLALGSGENRDGASWFETFPFDFDAYLDSELKIIDLKFRADTSSFLETWQR